MSKVIVFNGLNSLDFEDVRMNVVRIPEVSAKIAEAQAAWDKFSEVSFSFTNFLCSENEVFLKDIHLKSLAAAVVQVGLYERHLKSGQKPELLVGCANCDSALHVAVGKKSLGEMIMESQAFKRDQPQLEEVPLQLVKSDSPLLSGISLTEFQAYEWSEEAGEYTDTELREMDLNKLVQKLIDDKTAKQFVNVGPGNLLLADLQKELALSEVQILESIDLDPMLSWFWPTIKRSQVQVAV